VSEPEITDKNKFTLDGSIHGKPISTYIQEQLEIRQRRPRIILAILSVLLGATFLWGAISQYKLLSQEADIKQFNTLKHSLEGTKSIANQSEAIKDSLENIIYKLRTENEILAENSDPPIGVFFEVQIGSFTDFNIDQYNTNLANLRQEKHDGKTKFLLGRFRSFKKALLFENDLKHMGINNAFIVGRIDDKIVTYKEALQALE